MRTVTGTLGLAASLFVASLLLPAAAPSPNHAAPQHANVGRIIPPAVPGGIEYAVSWLQGIGATVAAAQADPIPTSINHQGVVMVDGARYTGTGYFRFAIVDPQDGDKNRWTHDGSQLNIAAMPASAVSVPVTDGIYTIRLGDSPTSAITSGVFADGSLALRIWFTHDGNDPQQLTPDHQLSSTPYSMRADSVSTDAVTQAGLAGNAVTSAKLANDAGSLSKVTNGVMAMYSGRVGIGTSTPAVLFTVSGHVRVLGGTGDGAIATDAGTSGGDLGLRGLETVAIGTQSGSGAIRFYKNNNGNDLSMIVQSGNVGIGTSTPSERLDVNGKVRCTQLVQTSTRAAKTDIHDLNTADSLCALTSLRPVSFRFKDRQQETLIGFIAEEVPEMVATRDRQTLDPMQIVAVLTKVVQEQQKEIDALKREVQVIRAGQ